MLVVLFAFALVVSGCTSQSSGDSQSDKGTTIRFIAEASGLTDALESLVPEFTQETGIKVEFEKYPYESVVQKAMLDFTSGTQTYDVVSLPYEFLGRVAEKGYVRPIDDYLNDTELTPADFDRNDIIPAMWNGSAKWNEQYYGFPSNPTITFMWYRKDLIENAEEKSAFAKKYGYELNVPETPQQLKDVAEFFTRKKGESLAGAELKTNFYGMAIMAKRHAALTADWLNWAWAFNGGVFEEGYDSGKIAMNSKANEEALNYYISLFDYAVPGSVDYTWDEVTTAMQQNIAFGAINYNDQIPNLLDVSKSMVSDKMGYSLLPSSLRKAAAYGAWTYMIPSESKHPKEAYRFLEWAMSKDIQKKWTLLGGIPARESIFNEPDIKAIDYMPITLEALKISDLKPRISEWGEMDSVMSEELHKAVTKQISPKEALDRLQKEFERILKENK
jgi:multiple sugar transport system substrate-binding protein